MKNVRPLAAKSDKSDSYEKRGRIDTKDVENCEVAIEGGDRERGGGSAESKAKQEN